MRWPRSPAKKSAFGRAAEGGQKARLGGAEVLRHVDDGEVVRAPAGAHRIRDASEHFRARHGSLRLERLPYEPGKIGHSASRWLAAEAGLAPQPGDVAVVIKARNEP